MKEIKTIVVPVDFLQYTDQLVEFAMFIGQRFNACLKFIHVVELPNNWGDSDYPSLALLPHRVESGVRKKMKEFVDKQKENYPLTEGIVDMGDVASSIVDYAKEAEADLIIIGTHGRKGFTKLWLGSVADRVIKLAPCPTLTCNPYK